MRPSLPLLLPIVSPNRARPRIRSAVVAGLWRFCPLVSVAPLTGRMTGDLGEYGCTPLANERLYVACAGCPTRSVGRSRRFLQEVHGTQSPAAGRPHWMTRFFRAWPSSTGLMPSCLRLRCLGIRAHMRALREPAGRMGAIITRCPARRMSTRADPPRQRSHRTGWHRGRSTGCAPREPLIRCGRQQAGIERAVHALEAAPDRADAPRRTARRKPVRLSLASRLYSGTPQIASSCLPGATEPNGQNREQAQPPPSACDGAHDMG